MAGTQIQYAVEMGRDLDAGIVPVPSSDRTKPVAMIDVGGVLELKRVAWTVQRSGDVPVLPSPAAFGGNDVFLRGSQSAATPIRDHDGRQVWVVSGWYLYALRESKGLTAPLPTGRPPWESGAASSNAIPSSAFQTGVLSDSGTQILQGIAQ